jgi:hypothetical protein
MQAQPVAILPSDQTLMICGTGGYQGVHVTQCKCSDEVKLITFTFLIFLSNYNREFSMSLVLTAGDNFRNG